MSLDLERAVGDVLADLAQVGKILGVDRQLVNLDVIGDILGVGPAQDSIVGSVKDVLSIGTGEVGGEWHVEGVVNDWRRSIERLRRAY